MGRSGHNHSASRIVFFNQGAGPLLREFVASAADLIGPVTYYAHDTVLGALPGVRMVKTTRHRNDSAIGRISSWLTYMLFAGVKGLMEPGNPLLFIVTNPPLSPVLGYIAKKLKGQRYALLFYDIYPEALERFTRLSNRSLISRVWRRLNQLALHNADRVITISPQIANMLLQYWPTGNDRAQIDIVPTWVDTDRIRPFPKAENWFAQKHLQVEKLTVLYAGNLGAMHDISMLPEVADRLRDHVTVHFLIIGEGARKKDLDARCAELGLQNVTLLPLQDESVLPYSLATGDVALVALASGAEGVCMPSKTYYMMAAGNALLGLSQAGSDLDMVIQKYQCGVNIFPGDVDSAVRAITQYLANPAILQSHRQAARQAAESYFSRDACIPKMLDIIRPLVSS